MDGVTAYAFERPGYVAHRARRRLRIQSRCCRSPAYLAFRQLGRREALTAALVSPATATWDWCWSRSRARRASRSRCSSRSRRSRCTRCPRSPAAVPARARTRRGRAEVAVKSSLFAVTTADVAAVDDRCRLGDARRALAAESAPADVRDAVAHGDRRARCRAGCASPRRAGGEWITHQWIKKAVLLSFRLADNAAMGATGPAARRSASTTRCRPSSRSYDDAAFAQAGVRVVPPAVARRGAYIAKNVVLMPSYVNIGAYVDEGTMVDTWATVGSCAQIGKNVHLSGGVGIGGVLEPLQANPTIIEDNCFIGARSEVVEGVIVEENSVLGMGVFIGQSTKIYDRATRRGQLRPRAGGIGRRRGQPAVGRRRLPALLRGHRQAGRREDAREDQHQRAAAQLTSMRAPLTMSVSIKTPEDIARMRVAGRLAAELLDYLTPHVKPGIDHGEIDQLAHDYMVERAAHDPGDAQLRAARARARTPLRCARRSTTSCATASPAKEAQGRRHHQHRRHGDQGRLSRRHQPHVLRRHAVDPGEAARRRHLRGDVEGIRAITPGAHLGDIGAHDPAASPKSTASRSCASSAATASGASSTRSRRCCTTAGPGPGSSCSPG